MLKMLPLLVVGLWSVPSWAADISVGSGGVRSESRKEESKDTGRTTQLGLTARYEDYLSTEMNWLAQGCFGVTNYGAPDGGDAPSSDMGLCAGGGVRWYFKPFTTGIVPFIGMLGSIETYTENSFAGLGYTHSRTTGLFYEGDVGTRIAFNEKFFIEFELELFKSALYAITETETNDGKGNTTKRERSRMELFAKSSAPLTSIGVNLGMKL